MTKLEKKLIELGYEEQPQDEQDLAYSEKTYHKYFGNDKKVYIQIVIQLLYGATISCAYSGVEHNIISEELLIKQRMALIQLEKDLEKLKEYENNN